MTVRTGIVAAVSVLDLVLGGCSEPGGTESESLEPSQQLTSPIPAPSPLPSTESPSPSPEPEPSQSPTWTDDEQAAVDTVNEFFRLLNLLLIDDSQDLEMLATVATVPVQSIWVDAIEKYRADGILQVGEITHVIGTVEVIEQAERQSYVSVRVCTDNSQTELIEKDTGENVTDPDRVSTISWTFDVIKLDDSWLVWDLTNERAEQCSQ